MIIDSEKEVQENISSKTEKEETNSKKRNFCGECHCSCTCDEGCNGDIKNCTSKKALDISCNHCCSCFVAAMVKNFQERKIKCNAK